jgi:ATP-dependent RNA helicase RhlE
VLTPTRELAAQIGESIAHYGAHLPLRHTVIYGGVGQAPQVAALRRGVDFLVACPGRLLDLLEQRLVDLHLIEHFVLDEADRMLDMGFIHDVRRIIARLPTQRQTLFFSATVPPEIRELAQQLLTDPVQVQVAPISTTADGIDQRVYQVGRKRKIALLKHLLKDRSLERCLIFTRTKHGADRVAKQLNKVNIRAEAIHGNKSQNARIRALEAFKAGKSRVLVASDLASRGIDIEDISHVINFELPHEPETYVHRIGRTGRAGRTGVAISFCEQEEQPRLRKIERLIRQRVTLIEDHPYIGSDADASDGDDDEEGGEGEATRPIRQQARPRAPVQGQRRDTQPRREPGQSAGGGGNRRRRSPPRRPGGGRR